jgi:hypothetical protein
MSFEHAFPVPHVIVAAVPDIATPTKQLSPFPHVTVEVPFVASAITRLFKHDPLPTHFTSHEAAKHWALSRQSWPFPLRPQTISQSPFVWHRAPFWHVGLGCESPPVHVIEQWSVAVHKTAAA